MNTPKTIDIGYEGLKRSLAKAGWHTLGTVSDLSSHDNKYLCTYWRLWNWPYPKGMLFQLVWMRTKTVTIKARLRACMHLENASCDSGIIADWFARSGTPRSTTSFQGNNPERIDHEWDLPNPQWVSKNGGINSRSIIRYLGEFMTIRRSLRTTLLQPGELLLPPGIQAGVQFSQIRNAITQIVSTSE